MNFNLIKKAYAIPLGELRGPGPLGLIDRAPEEAVATFAGAISSIIGILTLAGGLWFLIQFILGSYQFITSGGESQKIKEAQQKLTYSFVGLFLIVSAIFILRLMATLLHVEFLNFAEIINSLTNF